MPSYSAIIKNATIFDGSGDSPKKSDIGIEGDRVAKIGDLNSEHASVEIDASGLYAVPGLIDLTNHSDTHWTLFDYPSQENLLYQGVTTIIGGNCGSSLAPLTRPSDIGDLQKWADVSKANINWQSFGEFIREVENHRMAINFGSFVGHGTARRASGMDVGLAANQDDLKKILYLIHASMEEGALGISTGLGREHSQAADDEEVLSILSQVKGLSGTSVHHLADEGAGIVGAVSRIVSLSRASNSKSHISHFKVLGKKSWPKQKSALEIIERARADGLKITADFFPYTATGSDLYLLLPEWAVSGQSSDILEKLSNDNMKNKITEELRTLTLHYEKIIIASTLKDTGVIGKSLKDIADNAGLSPEETIIELLATNDLQVSIFNEAISEENLFELSKKDYTAISSDGYGLSPGKTGSNLTHPRSFGAFSRAFKMLVREMGILTWEEAVRKMTALPAEIAGLNNRGSLKKGFFADIAVFDPLTIGDTADYKNPSQLSRGIKWVFVNGIAALVDGTLGAKPGRVIYRNSF
ncbi:MAG: hypothetical protein A2931_03805 [Candidatus Niyogibacteria bacterium RIFCSPLOWO2_01_FULL_45_48]|uniref:Amidohydrolase 3 domain-containing protein n=2 Tax=Candidatus Niyogiibacteriota TaxID=1817912 RepID=A0A1G2EZD8_9BACT|nr:MAG: hypothetical protein A2835_00535 [Candidatus Niyogibacteria bacterium RIFCSPHIGHO2_01_FULL_45_28]OGZ30638.1 MAG: hypothetical protein A3J00_00500 [Candidatus Niyogibacteria bacterium RIFCSPLOWO2_02_FULL_45_13]OGZ31499.1 MAG: hypothetical protein A2931_03805 [Candidatus Niyogibacteria bacterium RIFCSPLOWO2_01_FULL_45_48]